MSRRTIPESSRTFTPFEPSPGYGPAVSSGTSSTSPDADDEADAVGMGAREPAAADEGELEASASTAPHAARREVSATPPKMPRARRRPTIVRTS